ncbi:MAG: response regulator [Clostridia bacterium]|nr:response regulator [Clostridia bacterium]
MYSILIVDDSNVERRGIRRLLEKYNGCFNITEACDGEEAFEQICKNDIDIVFTDVRMPIVDGIKLLKMIKEHDGSIQTVIISAYNDFEYTSKAIENKADHYILKPIDVDTFNKVLVSVIEAVDRKRSCESQEKEIIRNLVDFSEEADFVYENRAYRDVFNAIVEKDTLRIVRSTEDLFANFRSSKSMSVLYVKQICVEISKRLCKLIKDEKKELNNILNEIVLKKNYEEIETYMLEMVRVLTDKVLKENETDEVQLSAPVKTALEIVRKRFQEDISLESIAEEVALSSKYFGQLFKKEMNVGFVKYLTHYRLERAEKLLNGTSMNINDICRQIGIQDPSYFCFVFKKKYGESPDRYRKKAGDK